MSVYTVPTYHDDAYASLFDLVRGEADAKTYLLRFENFKLNKTSDVYASMVFNGNTMNDMIRHKDFEEIYFKNRRRTFSNYMKKGYRLILDSAEFLATQWKHGLQAVYGLWASICRRTADDNKSGSAFWMTHAVACSSGLLAGRLGDNKKKNAYESESFAKHIAPYAEAAQRIVRFALAWRSREMRDLREDLENKNDVEGLRARDHSLLRHLEFYPFPNLLAVKDTDKMYFLTRHDVDKVARLLRGVTAFRAHSLRHPSEGYRLAATEFLKHIVTKAKDLSWEQAQGFCRAQDLLYNLILAKHAEDLSDGPTKAQQAKCIREGFEWFKIEQMEQIVRLLPIVDQLEIASLYKIMPQPDFDYHETLKRQKELYDKKNTISDRTQFGKILNHYRFLLCKAFFLKHARLPGVLRDMEDLPEKIVNYPQVEAKDLVPSDMAYIDFNGEFNFPDFDEEIIGLTKDKATCPEGCSELQTEYDLQRLPRAKKNQLLDFLSHPQDFKISNILENWNSHDFDVKTDDKPEAKKPNGRLFFEASSPVRYAQSAYENAISNYAKLVPGLMQGKNRNAKMKMMNMVTEVLDQPVIDIVSVFVSIDIDKFSPRLPVEVHEALDEIWAEAFGMDVLKRFSNIYKKGKIHYIRKSFHYTMEKTGADFEGFAGKKLTLYHLAVANASLEELRKKRMIQGTHRIAAQIDDAIIRVLMSKDDAAQAYEKLLPVMNVYWRAAGMEISVDKTFVSTRLAVFLNEIRYFNKTIINGVKTLVKITNKTEELVDHVVAQTRMAETTVRGAIKQGAMIVNAYELYVYYFLDAIRQHSKGTQLQIGPALIPWMMAPLELGGLALRHPFSLMGALEQHTQENGLFALYQLHKSVPMFRETIAKILGQELAEKDPSAIPGVISRRAGEIFSTAPVLGQIISRVAPALTVAVLQDMRINKEILTEWVTSWLRGNGPQPIAQLVYASSPQAMIEKLLRKIETSGTVLALLGYRNHQRLMRRQRSKAKAVFNSWVQ